MVDRITPPSRICLSRRLIPARSILPFLKPGYTRTTLCSKALSSVSVIRKGIPNDFIPCASPSQAESGLVNKIASREGSPEPYSRQSARISLGRGDSPAGPLAPGSIRNSLRALLTSGDSGATADSPGTVYRPLAPEPQETRMTIAASDKQGALLNRMVRMNRACIQNTIALVGACC